MGTRTVTITATRYYSKTTTIEVEVEDELIGEDLQTFLTEDEDINDQLEEGLGNASLSGDDTSYEFQDPNNNFGGTL